MSNKRDLTAFVRLDANRRVVSGSLVLRKTMPKSGNWMEVPTYECCPDPVPDAAIPSKGLRAFVRFDGSGRVVSGSLILRKKIPKVGRWREIDANQCCNFIPLTTTTTTAAPITTTTTTAAPITTTTTTVAPLPSFVMRPTGDAAQANACNDATPGLAEYFDGAGATPVPGDIVYSDDGGNTPFAGADRFYRDDVIAQTYQISSAGLVLSVDACI